LSGNATSRDKPAAPQSEPGPAPAQPRPWAPPDPERPRASELFIAAAMISLLAALVLWGGAASEADSLLVLGAVEPARALDAAAVPSGAFIVVTGHPDATRLTPIYSTDPRREQDLLLPLREAPGLVLHCRHDHPLVSAIRRRLGPAPADKAGTPAADLGAAWTFSGRIQDADTYSDPRIASSGISVREFASQRLGLKDGEPVRVLAVGTVPDDVRRAARTAAVFGAGLTVVAIVLWILAFHGVLQARRAGRAANAPPS